MEQYNQINMENKNRKAVKLSIDEQEIEDIKQILTSSEAQVDQLKQYNNQLQDQVQSSIQTIKLLNTDKMALEQMKAELSSKVKEVIKRQNNKSLQIISNLNSEISDISMKTKDVSNKLTNEMDNVLQKNRFMNEELMDLKKELEITKNKNIIYSQQLNEDDEKNRDMQNDLDSIKSILNTIEKWDKGIHAIDAISTLSIYSGSIKVIETVKIGKITKSP